MKKLTITKVLLVISLLISVICLYTLEDQWDKSEIDKVKNVLKEYEYPDSKEIEIINYKVYDTNYKLNSLNGHYNTHKITFNDPNETNKTKTIFYIIDNNKEVKKLSDFIENNKVEPIDKNKIRISSTGKIFEKTNNSTARNNFSQEVFIGLILLAGFLVTVHYHYLKFYYSNNTTSENTPINQYERFKSILIYVNLVSFKIFLKDVLEKNIKPTKEINMSEKINKRVLSSALISYSNIFLSFFTTISLFKLYSKYSVYRFFATSSTKLIETKIDYFLYFILILTIVVFIATLHILTKFIKKDVHIVLFAVISIISYLLLLKEVSIFHQLISIYIGSLCLNYLIITSSINVFTKLYEWTITSKEDKRKQLDPTKLTLLWTIMVFILGLLFNFKK
ncbi:hypothetical protein [Gemella sanguinis]|uniref:hypothetical protein n=1 Tax=Gemella sanguinis TaxID=84135 RepID=UPI0004E1CF87|nr:hypothetical protein [Gemella sanguinis]NKZ26088.1 hypothetical protein [Gemella sanguinis]